MISEGYYTGYEYDESMSIINSILSQDEDELLALGFNLGDQKRSHYRYGMMSMKLGDYQAAVDGFSSSLRLSDLNATETCEPCEFNFSEREEADRSFEWWHAHYNRRLALTYMLNGNFSEASEYLGKAFELNHVLQESDESTAKCACLYGYVNGQLGKTDISEQKIEAKN